MAEISQQVFSLKTKKPIDDDSEMVDESALITDEDKQQKVVTEDGSCATRRTACKNCTCGRAQEEQEAVKLDLANAPRSECGNCSRGDAFRCANCPYLGKAAWKPGEKVQLDLNDDI